MKLFEITQNEINKMSLEQVYKYIKIHGSTPKLEDIIATSALFSYCCAYYVLSDRFYKGKPIISKDSYYAFQYAKNILGRRWLKAEPSIRKSEFYWDEYKEHFNIP